MSEGVQEKPIKQAQAKKNSLESKPRSFGMNKSFAEIKHSILAKSDIDP